MQKRPFKSNILIKYFGKTGLPKNWQKILKEVGEMLSIDPKNFFGWEEKIQLATIFVAKLDAKIPSKKNFIKLSRETSDNRWMIGKLSDLGPKALDEVKECMNRPQFLKGLLSKRVKEGSSKTAKMVPLMLKLGLKPTQQNMELYKAMNEIVSKDEHYYYQRDYNWSSLNEVYSKLKPFKHSIGSLKGKAGSISFHFEKSARTMFLDAASDCCQGVHKAGHTCMVTGHISENQSFLVFSRKGKIFAQSWSVVLNDETIILDSLETKGELNESLVEATKAVIKGLKKQFKYVVLGRSPNEEGRAIFRQLSEGSLSDRHLKKLNDSIREYIRKNSNIYTDLKNGYYVY